MAEQYTIEQYRAWLLGQISHLYTIHEEENRITYEALPHVGQVIFHPENIIELIISHHETEENEFYLHFQLNEEAHAKDLTTQMLSTLLKLKAKKKIRAVLTCSSALTTSFFAQKLNEAATILKLDMFFTAVSFDRIYQEGPNYDVILLAPQVAFQEKKVREILDRQTVIAIPGAMFARYESGDVIHLIQTEIAKKEDEGIPEETLPLKNIYENNYRILVICMIRHFDSNRIAYRIYDHGKKTLDKEVIKPTLDTRDIEDLLDYVLARHFNLDLIGLSLPGITNKGTVNLPESGMYHTNLFAYLTQKYHLPVVIINDVNAMAMGYYAMHDHCENMAFYFQPRGDVGSGAGFIVDGKLHMGFRHNSGEVGPLVRIMVDDYENKVYSPEGSLEIVSKALLSIIQTISPDKLVIYSEMTPNMDEMKMELEKYIEADYIPELVHVRRLKRYMMPGTMIRCLTLLKQDNAKPGWLSQMRNSK